MKKKVDISSIIDKLGPIIAVILLSIILTIITDKFMTLPNWMNLLRQTSINAIVSLGMFVVMLTAGIDLSLGAICAFTSCLMGVAMQHGVPVPLLFVIIIGGGCLGGVLNGVLFTKLDLPHPFISTLGSMMIFNGLALIITGAKPISGFPKSITWIGSASIGKFPVCFIAVLIVYVIVGYFLANTVTGKNIYAVGGNDEAARLAGVNVKKIQCLTYIIAGALCGLAALILTGRVGTALPTAGSDYAMDGVASCVIGGTSFSGGKGSVSGTLIGALLIQILRNGLNLLGQSSDVQSVVIGAVIIGAVYMDVVRNKRSAKARRMAQAKAHAESVAKNAQ
ncbi:MAG: ABC transporter permease [Blautia sp.]|nr:ABC transporter permease [Blautia sp.]